MAQSAAKQSDSTPAAYGKVVIVNGFQQVQPIPIPRAKPVEPSLTASKPAEEVKKPSTAPSVPDTGNSWHHRRYRQPGHDSRVKRPAETQGDYKIGAGGYARVREGEGECLNHGRYEVIKKLGVGHFSCVYLCWDNEEGGHVAVKVIRSNTAYHKSGYKEDQLLTVLQGPQDERRQYIVSFLDSFEHPDPDVPGAYHYCLVFEVLGMSLAEVLRANNFAGFPLNVAKSIIKQCLLGLSYLHSLSIAHTDVKTENIVLYHTDIEAILKKQLRLELIAKLKKEEQERLRPADLRRPKQPYVPKTPGLNAEQIKHMQDTRERADRERWEITPVIPIASPIGFMKAGKSPARPATDRTSVRHPGETVVTPARRTEAPKNAIGISPPAPLDILDSGFKTGGASRLPPAASNLTLSRAAATSRNTSPLLARALAAHDKPVYAHGAPLERYPSRHYIATPLGADDNRHPFEDTPLGSISFENDRQFQFDAEVSVETTATAAGRSSPIAFSSAKSSPLAKLDTQNCHANLIPPDASSISSSLIGSQLSIGSAATPLSRHGSGSALGPSSGSGSSQNGDGWLSGSFMSSHRAGGSSSSLESSFTNDSVLRGFQPSSPSDALSVRWERDNTPSQPLYTSIGGMTSSSSPIASKYGINTASSASIDAVRTQGQSIFRPNVIPHPLLAPYQPAAPSIEDRLRQLALREDRLAAEAAEQQKAAKPVFDPVVKVKIADLGNAIFYAEAKANKTLPTHVCTRYYREPGNIIGAEYDLGIDVWALGCTLFELITGDILFNPESRRPSWTKDDDHLAQQIELLGNFPVEFALCGDRSWKFFDASAKLKRRPVEPYGLYDVLRRAYKMPREQARSLTDFLLRMLEPIPNKRATVDELLTDPWLDELEEDEGYVVHRHKCSSACRSSHYH